MKSTKKSLIASALSLVLCVSMLLGTTYAWFTDSVESGINQITAGNLDVELIHTNKTAADEKVTTNTKLFTDVKLWEPGALAYETLTVKNVGTLALKYRMSMNFENETKVNGHGLSEILKVGTIEGKLAANATRESVVAQITSWAPLASFAKTGALEAKTDDTPITYVIYWEPSANDDLYNMKNELQGKTLSIDFGIVLVATQYTSEKDSFDELYDVETPWLGEIAETVPYDEETKTYTVRNGAELAKIAQMVNNGESRFSGMTVKLAKDIDLNNIEWAPMGNLRSYPTITFAGTFDGQDHTILNMNASDMSTSDDHSAAGFFGSTAGATIKNLKFKNATVTSTHYAGVVVGYEGSNSTKTTISNVSIDGAMVTSTPFMVGGNYDNGDKAGGFVGYCTSLDITDSNIKNANIYAFRDIGGFIGAADGTYGSSVKNCSIGENVNLHYLFVLPSGNSNKNMGDFIGRELNNPVMSGNSGEASKEAANLIKTTEELVMLANTVNAGSHFDGTTFTLGATLDFEGGEMPPIGIEPGKDFRGTFDGNGMTVKNVNIYSDSGSGFIGYIGGGTLKNLTLENVHTKGIEHVGVLVGYTATGAANITGNTVKNCSATGVMRDATDNSANGIGVLIGHVAQGGGTINITNNTVDTVTLKGYRRIGGLAGGAATSSMSGVNIFGNTLQNVTIIQDLTMNNNPNGLAAKATVGEYLGELYGEDYLDDVMAVNTVSAKIEVIRIPDVHQASSDAEVTTAITQAQDGDIIELAASDTPYKIQSTDKKLTMKAKGDKASGTATINATGEQHSNIAAVPNGASFEGFVISVGPDDYHGFQHPGPLEFTDCDFTGMFNVYGDTVFTGCTFTNKSGYCVKVYGGSKVEFIDCKFYGSTKDVYLYQESLSSDRYVSFTKCVFNQSNTEGKSNKSAVMINACAINNSNSWNDHRYTLVFTECSTTGGVYSCEGASTRVGDDKFEYYCGLWGLKAHDDFDKNVELQIPATIKVENDIVYDKNAN